MWFLKNCFFAKSRRKIYPVKRRQSKGQNNPSGQSTFGVQGCAASGNSNVPTSSGATNNDNNQNNNGINTNQQVATFSECANCPQHRGLLMNLSAIVQAVVISCPAALVWHDLGEGKQFSTLNGSPLDLLPCSPLVLPMPAGDDNKEVCFWGCYGKPCAFVRFIFIFMEGQILKWITTYNYG